jgi:C_GCAxxG_C_C family probable redox protein
MSNASEEAEGVLKQVAEIRQKAEAYYRDGDFYCSEAIVKTIKDAYGVDVPDAVVAMASGFPVGIGGAGCTCGALSGGVMALGLFFGRECPRDPKVNKAMQLSNELHKEFIGMYGSTCCRKLTKGMELGSEVHMKQCIEITGKVAEMCATIIDRETGAGLPCRN